MLILKLSVFGDSYLCCKGELTLNEIITGSEYKASICFCSLGLPQLGGVNIFGSVSTGFGGGSDCFDGFSGMAEDCGTELISGYFGSISLS
jgi:hypothetical protein